jgi:hypothetical protein
MGRRVVAGHADSGLLWGLGKPDEAWKCLLAAPDLEETGPPKEGLAKLLPEVAPDRRMVKI